ncbi:hypothetical protein D3D01_15720 [Haloarcula sp. Atlit-7R]|nr:hypothetical protein D3D01_15720 [Haloarcula sp. Atlit-7R]
MSMNGPTLTDFAEEHGTADSISNSNTDTTGESGEDSPDDIPAPLLPLDGAVGEEYIFPDRHVSLNQVPQYWENTRNSWNLIPKGAFSIIFDSTSCQNGWPKDSELQTGVYLRGKHISNPPAPVEVDDQLLCGAATTAAQAAYKILSEYDLTDAPVVGLTKECSTSLSIYLDARKKPRQQTVFHRSAPENSELEATIPPTKQSPALFHGFEHIRLFNKSIKNRSNHPGHEIYTEATKPRLSLDDIGWTGMLNDSL